jgi:hypothetical protein
MIQRGRSAEELEFLNEDSMNDNSSAMNQSNNFNVNTVDGNGGSNSEIGAWFLKQSKVSLLLLLLFGGIRGG